MKTKTIEARRAGWIMEWRLHRIHKRWHMMPESKIYDTRRECISSYDKPDYREMARNGLWRCVAVYVEVLDEKA